MTNNLWVGTGWKMNHLLGESEQYAQRLATYCYHTKPEINLFVCVPYTAINLVSNILKDTDISVGSQNSHWDDRGAYTGEISALMVKDSGATMVELGHSERRLYFGEDELIINKKVKTVLRNGMLPLVCIGESLIEKQSGSTIDAINRQMKLIFHDIKLGNVNQLIIAYEPIWAIGSSGTPAQPSYINEVHNEIKSIISDLWGKETKQKIPVIYGGSVNEANAVSFLSMKNIDGLFIGRAAWDVEGFIRIINKAVRELNY